MAVACTRNRTSRGPTSSRKPNAPLSPNLLSLELPLPFVAHLRTHPLVSTQTLWALYPSSRELAPKVRVFLDWLVARFGPEPYWDEGI
jgi:DNA-binding transcriptional LysR family regulator